MVMSSKWMRLIGLVGFTAVLVSCKQTPQAPMNANYATMKITVSDKKFSTSYSATIRGRQDIDIYPQVSGTIERLCVTEGEKVRKGQILFVIDQVPYKAALNTAIANVKSAKRHYDRVYPRVEYSIEEIHEQMRLFDNGKYGLPGRNRD